MVNPELDLNDSMIKSFLSSDAKDIAIDWTEIALDSVLTSGLLKDIPVIGTGVKISKTLMSLRDKIFAKKVISFLRPISDIPNKKREEFLKELEDNNKVGLKAGEILVMFLEQLDKIEKAEILGKLVKARISGKIDYPTFERLSSMVVRVYFADLGDLVKVHKGETIDRDIKDSLASIGLMTRKAGGLATDGNYVSIGISINNYGKLLVELTLND